MMAKQSIADNMFAEDNGDNHLAQSTFTVLSWNIWFGRLSFRERSESILRFVEDILPSVVCFQEVTARFVSDHLNQSKLLDLYDCSDDGSGKSLGSYGVLMLCKKELKVCFEVTEFVDSAMDRSLLSATFRVNGEPVVVGTVHLESLNNHPNRVKQLQVCNAQLSPFSHAILCGDFNFCSYRNYNPDPSKPLENDSLAVTCPEFSDMWLKLKVDPVVAQMGESAAQLPSVAESLPEHVLGYTFDSVLNQNVSSYERFRLDRVVYKLPEGCGAKLQPQDIKIIGKTPINQEELDRAAASAAAAAASVYSTPPRGRSDSMSVPVFPSDHFGLLATFSMA
jgi:endonuclease/exonuclease/phosphatase family metal-dependent hydrolase